jgi:hypothetical protein
VETNDNRRKLTVMILEIIRLVAAALAGFFGGGGAGAF